MGVGGLIMPPSSGSQRDREQGRKFFLMSLLELCRFTPCTCTHAHTPTHHIVFRVCIYSFSVLCSPVQCGNRAQDGKRQDSENKPQHTTRSPHNQALEIAHCHISLRYKSTFSPGNPRSMSPQRKVVVIENILKSLEESGLPRCPLDPRQGGQDSQALRFQRPTLTTTTGVWVKGGQQARFESLCFSILHRMSSAKNSDRRLPSAL